MQYKTKKIIKTSHATPEKEIDYTTNSHHLDTGYAEVNFQNHVTMPL
jgi:hypothetical protein